jgi:hypothetical protein
MLQGDGRHDSPHLFGCLYVSLEAIATVAEQLARLTGTFVDEADLVRGGQPLSLATISLPDEAELVDLDDPAVLTREGLRPSRVATGDRTLTQAQAASLFQEHREAVGLRWWSTFESLWANVTLFDRAGEALGLDDVRPLDLGDEVVLEAARFLGLRLTT